MTMKIGAGWHRLLQGAAVSLLCVSPLALAAAASKSAPESAGSPESASRISDGTADEPVTTRSTRGSELAMVRAARLNRLHEMLLAADNERAGAAIAGQIWEIWLTHPDAEVNDVMKRVQQASAEQRWKDAVSLLDRLVQSVPDYAEAWNQRATIRYLLGDYEGSLADIDKTLAVEPRHFGALSGRGMVQLRMGRQSLAWQSFESARRVHPWIASRNLVPPEAQETDT